MKKYITIILTLVLCTIFLQMGCENDYPDSLWPPSETYKPNPVINAVYPIGGTFALPAIF